MNRDTIVGAGIAALINLATNLIALFSQDHVISMADITQATFIVVFIGAILAFLKDYQALSTRRIVGRVLKSKMDHPPPVAKSGMLAGVGAIILALAMLSGCGHTQNAYSEAEGLTETSTVIGEHYYALIKEANRLRASGALSGSALEQTQSAVRTTAPIVSEMLKAAEIYEQFKSADTELALSNAITAAALAVARIVGLLNEKDQATGLIRGELNYG